MTGRKLASIINHDASFPKPQFTSCNIRKDFATTAKKYV